MNRKKTKDQRGYEEDTTDEAQKSFLTLPLIEGQVTGLPKDLASAPTEIRLPPTIHERGSEALQRTQQSGKEYGFFIHFDETGHMTPGEVRAPSEQAEEGEWITRAEYLAFKNQDESIQGLLHTHPTSPEFPGGELTFSEGNLGTLLEVEDALLLCKGPQEEYLLALRTQQTPTRHEGIGEKVIMDCYEILPSKLAEVLVEGLEGNLAISSAVFKAMVEICKNYNIAIYKGEPNKAARKVTADV